MKYQHPMVNFRRLAEGLPIGELAAQVKANDHLFSIPPKKYKPWMHGYTHREIRYMGLRCNNVSHDMLTNKESFKRGSDDLIAFDLPAYGQMTEARALVYMVMAAVGGSHIGRVAITDIPAGRCIYEHIDEGLSSDYFTRYHLLIEGHKESWCHCGGEDDEENVEMLTGELWTFNHQKPHSFTNLSKHPRLCLNIDIA